MEEVFSIPQDKTPGYCGYRGRELIRDWLAVARGERRECRNTTRPGHAGADGCDVSLSAEDGASAGNGPLGRPGARRNLPTNRGANRPQVRRRLRGPRGSVADPLNLLRVMPAKGCASPAPFPLPEAGNTETRGHFEL